jgi:hypothetical protein
VWQSPDAPVEIAAMPALWGAATGTFQQSRHPSPLLPSCWDVPEVEVESSTIHGRSCYLGRDRSGRHFFAKGIGWIHCKGWQPNHGNCGVFPRWGAERERDFALRFAEVGVSVVQPIAIIAHQSIPDVEGDVVRLPAEVLDLDGQPAAPCMYVYSSASRWRLADLFYLSESERGHIQGVGQDRCEWLQSVLTSVGRSCGLLHTAGGHDYSLSSHNVFCDGTRVDFEYAYLPTLPHRESALNADAEAWRDKELDGLRRLAWEIAELMRLDVPVTKVTRWWETAYQSVNDQPATGAFP